ncbi:bifunctional diaminohydroxyphosphoribosylaminopyrimidine deaminase/5-amino-6-(5-phosphoribosylamino)uracil reductase RibD [Vibrio sp. Of7-15]|uniref:bifunctional diaminohydroxyphosphoribosylaminopyrimidine deaminase/5-amino-6-(5-phosphoribosylamino)uracil reductase RibD n=1 Tax=Vibrio sp. Of7-15 TaxID=2724879 RepID=UPI001EF1F293|nr:bifunctional diaminohydroxyphosphoribosylaminopyrimidine deaminase/5-amino-6-(5-phosphoribosylamino)uracil reductase RibD [Vibrio sp. Of7-15]MCG7499654.1 bifunctional diaminohydroxyphosphoribosylaminopyrimidine deaminase/5-amino-6-(5-phosphoribosylamino)uracil reductase RibD [Vibrio sp. Of7-15]
MTVITDEMFMRQALTLSKRALPHCRPNPPVGCVLVKNGNIISEGFTQPPGEHHAEAHAIANYQGSFEGVTAYVTLEPCSFVGRTPSCANTLAQLGVKRVVVALIDSDPRNNGAGLNILTEAGVEISTGILQQEVADFITPYLINK